MNVDIRFEWDAAKAASNKRKHGVSFELAQRVFSDPYHISEMDRVVDGEQRWQTIGVVGGVAMILVAHTWKEFDGTEVIRIISARPADKHERKRYEH